MTGSDEVVLLVATEHRQGSIDARRLDDGRSVRLAFGVDEAVGALTDEVDAVVVDDDLDEASVEDVLEAADRADSVVVALTRRGDAPPWADAAVDRPVDGDAFGTVLADLRD